MTDAAKIALLCESGRGAVLSDCGRYRYALGRVWAGGPTCHFVMLNPSTADAQEDDPTIRRCIGYARQWGFGCLMVTNLFALRSTDPGRLRRAGDPIGPDNDQAILSAAARANLTVCAWGAHGSFLGRSKDVRRLLAGANVPLHYLALTSKGEPGHPLYLSASLKPTPWAHS